MTQNDHSPITNLFIDRLGKLDAGGRARLKRSAGRPLAEARDSLALFYRLLPSGIHPAQEEWYFLIATLYPPGGRAGKPATWATRCGVPPAITITKGWIGVWRYCWMLMPANCLSGCARPFAS